MSKCRLVMELGPDCASISNRAMVTMSFTLGTMPPRNNNRDLNSLLYGRSSYDLWCPFLWNFSLSENKISNISIILQPSQNHIL